jgi:hypothetical protein
MSVLTGGMTRPDSAYSPAGHPQDSCRPLESFSLLTLGTCIQGFVLAAIATLVGGHGGSWHPDRQAARRHCARAASRDGSRAAGLRRMDMARHLQPAGRSHHP